MAQNVKREATDEMIAQVQKGSAQMSEAQAVDMAGKLYSAGKFKQAEKVCRQLIAHRDTLADAHNILGVALHAQGQSDEGIASLKRAIETAPRNVSYYGNLGEVQRNLGKLDDARKSLIQATMLDPSNAQSLNNLGIVHYEQGEHEAAVECYRKAIAARPEFAEAYNNLGNAERKLGNLDKAARAYHEALSIREVYPEAYNNLGTLLREQKKTDQAQHALRKAIQQNPRYTEAHNNLAAVLHMEGNDTEALRQMTEVLRFDPENRRALLLAARIQLKRANYDAVTKACSILIKKDRNDAEAIGVLAHLRHDQDKYDAAVTLMERAVALAPDSAELRSFYGVTLKSVGRLDDAREQILKAIELEPRMFGAYANLNDLVDFSERKDLFEKLTELMKSTEDTESERLTPLIFAYAKALDDNGKHEDALQHYIEGGRRKRKTLPYDEENSVKFFADIKQAFPASRFTKRSFAGNDSDRPVFIVGMPRSGSTLVEQIISAHPDVYGAGEVKYFSRSMNLLRDRFPTLPAYPAMIDEMDERMFAQVADKYLQTLTADAGDHKRVTDKMLTNYLFVGFINLLFPNARIINTRRNPVDTCLSAFTKLFKDDMPHSYDLGELGRYYARYDDLMSHWQEVLPKGVLHTVQYEDMVGDTEKTAREVIKFLGLKWNPACLDFHNSKRPVKTASVAQVRKPIYTTAVERWRKYGDGMQPLVDIVGA